MIKGAWANWFELKKEACVSVMGEEMVTMAWL